MSTETGGAQPATGVIATEERDPVCGMRVDPATATYRHAHAGRSYYFCAQGCFEKFQARPEQYLGASRPLSLAARPTTGAIPPPAVTYTCPTPGGRQAEVRSLPEMWYGARAGDHCHRAAEGGIHLPDAP